MSRAIRILAAALLPILCMASPARSQEDGKVLDKTKVEWLSILEKDEKTRMRKAAVIALGIFGPAQKDILPVLGNSLAKDKEEDVRVQIVLTLKSLDPKKELRDLLPLLADVLKDDKSAAVRTGAAELIGRLGEYAKPALKTLIAALKDSDVGVRAAAADALGKIGPDAKAAVPEMLPLLKESDASVRFTTIFAYSRIGPAAAFVAPDINIIFETDPSSDVRREAARTLGLIGTSATRFVLPTIIKVLREDKSEEVRRQAAQTLAKMGDIKPVMKETLEIFRADKDRYVRLHLVRSIAAALGSNLKDYVKDLADWLNKDPDADVRLAIVQELGDLGVAAKEAIPALLDAENDVVIPVREAAKQAVLQVKGLAKKEPKKKD